NLSLKEQRRIFESSTKRKIILATNVAETSITVPNITHVIDSGLVRISRYNYRSKVQRLPIEAIAKANAEQRKGRCGRTQEGVCYRLYSAEDFLTRRDFTTPEIQRTNLAFVILLLAYPRMGDIESYPFIDAPEHRFVKDGQ